MNFRLPVIVPGENELLLFESVHDLVVKMGVEDLETGKIPLYDGDGFSLVVKPSDNPEHPLVKRKDEVAADENAVCSLFLDIFEKRDLGGVINREASLEDFIKLYVISYGYTR